MNTEEASQDWQDRRRRAVSVSGYVRQRLKEILRLGPGQEVPEDFETFKELFERALETRRPRIDLAPATPRDAANQFAKTYLERLDEHGWGGCVSTHEGYGIIAEEFKELGDALQANDVAQQKKECMDIMVAAAFMLSSLQQETLDGRKT